MVGDDVRRRPVLDSGDSGGQRRMVVVVVALNVRTKHQVQ